MLFSPPAPPIAAAAATTIASATATPATATATATPAAPVPHATKTPTTDAAAAADSVSSLASATPLDLACTPPPHASAAEFDLPSPPPTSPPRGPRRRLRRARRPPLPVTPPVQWLRPQRRITRARSASSVVVVARSSSSSSGSNSSGGSSSGSDDGLPHHHHRHRRNIVCQLQHQLAASVAPRAPPRGQCLVQQHRQSAPPSKHRLALHALPAAASRRCTMHAVSWSWFMSPPVLPPPPPLPLPLPPALVPSPYISRRRLPQQPQLHLTDLPDDVLARIILLLLNPVRVGQHSRIVVQSFVRALPLALASRRFHALFYHQMRDCEFWQTGAIDDVALYALARYAAPVLRRLVLRKCSRVSPHALSFLTTACSRLRALDISYIDLTDAQLAAIIRPVSQPLRALYLRGCHRLTDISLTVLSEMPALEVLDVALLPQISDIGMTTLARGLRHRLTMIVCSGCAQLGDDALRSLGLFCPRLEVVTCRGLSAITDCGVEALCRGVGASLAILDVLDCEKLSPHKMVQVARENCPLLARRYEAAEGRSLRQIVISSLSGFVFHVTGSDLLNGKAAVYYLLVDSGTSNSFRVSIGSSALDLTSYGSILASCFGNAPNAQVKHTLLTMYGLDLDAEDDAPMQPQE